MMNKFIMNPDLTMSGGGVCYGANSPVIIQRDPTSNLPNPNSIQDVNVPPVDQNVDVFQDPNNVAQNFHNSFINQEPRDILLVIDTSSSIFRDDFEVSDQW
nr:hypothetical protein BaRGS_025538 [Batillaria attramentaria]